MTLNQNGGMLAALGNFRLVLEAGPSTNRRRWHRDCSMRLLWKTLLSQDADHIVESSLFDRLAKTPFEKPF
jgi:hypothetical protein